MYHHRDLDFSIYIFESVHIALGLVVRDHMYKYCLLYFAKTLHSKVLLISMYHACGVRQMFAIILCS